MTVEEQTERRSRRGGGRDARRATRAASSTASAPYITRNTPVLDILSDEGAEIIENNAETILEEVGIDFKDDAEALGRGLADQLLADAGGRSFLGQAKH